MEGECTCAVPNLLILVILAVVRKEALLGWVGEEKDKKSKLEHLFI